MVRDDLSASADDQRALQGKWLMIRYEKDGLVSKSPLNALPRDLLLITGNSFELALPGRSPTDVGTFVLDCGHDPKNHHLDHHDRPEGRQSLTRDLRSDGRSTGSCHRRSLQAAADGVSRRAWQYAASSALEAEPRLVAAGSLFPQQIEKEHNGIFLAVEMADHLPP